MGQAAGATKVAMGIEMKTVVDLTDRSPLQGRRQILVAASVAVVVNSMDYEYMCEKSLAWRELQKTGIGRGTQLGFPGICWASMEKFR